MSAPGSSAADYLTADQAAFIGRAGQQIRWDDLDELSTKKLVDRAEPPPSDNPYLDQERQRRDAKAALAAEDAEPLRWWSVDEFLAAPSPEPLVAGFLYRDSLTRLFGPAGGGKSFVSLDLAIHVALGMDWCGRRITAGPVVYVMAEGQAVNHDRFEAWTNYHHVDRSALRGKFIAVPHAVLLTPPAMTEFLVRVEKLRPALVVIDTKNASMVGEENSATDTAVMRRALDSIRHRGGGCCVMLVDHTGHNNGDRARGSSAATAAMDTELQIDKDGAQLTVRVTRDKAAESGTEVAFTLTSAAPAAVLVPTTADRRAEQHEGNWRHHPMPPGVENITGPGSKMVPDAARYFAFHATGDDAMVGVSRSELARAIGVNPSSGSIFRAWSKLKFENKIIPATDGIGDTGRHVWTGGQAEPIVPLNGGPEWLS